MAVSVVESLRASVQVRAVAGEAMAALSEDVTLACRAMAARFQAGGRLMVFGAGLSAADAQHVAVEFLHPVLVGRRSLPAIALSNDVGTLSGTSARCGLEEGFAHAIRVLGRPEDMALGITTAGGGGTLARPLQAARADGLLAIALTGADPDMRLRDHVDHVLAVPSREPPVVRELQVTLYHVLWEMVHLFLERASSTTCGVEAP